MKHQPIAVDVFSTMRESCIATSLEEAFERDYL
jgi:hypothetical protein